MASPFPCALWGLSGTPDALRPETGKAARALRLLVVEGSPCLLLPCSFDVVDVLHNSPVHKPPSPKF